MDKRKNEQNVIYINPECKKCVYAHENGEEVGCVAFLYGIKCPAAEIIKMAKATESK